MLGPNNDDLDDDDPSILVVALPALFLFSLDEIGERQARRVQDTDSDDDRS